MFSTYRRVGLDLDDTLALTRQSLLEAAQERGLLRGRVFEDIRTMRIEESFPGEITWEQVRDIFRCSEFWEDIKPCPFLIDAAKDLIRRDVETHIVTARTPELFSTEMERITREWLWKNGIYCHYIAFVDAKDKARYCIDKRLDLFVEDRTDTAIAIGRTYSTQSYLVYEGWNAVPDSQKHLVCENSRPFYQNLYEKHYRLHVR